MRRREFVKRAASAVVLSGLGCRTGPSTDLGPSRAGRFRRSEKDGSGEGNGGSASGGVVDATHIPRWRGFNLQEMFGWGRKPGPFSELDFELMAEWGFNFVRLPMTYWNWSDRKDWLSIQEKPLTFIDQAIELGRQYGIHVNLNFHRIPGYCVSQVKAEPMQLFDGPEHERTQALAAATYHWKHFAARYKGIPNDRLSFDLLNEPPYSFADPAETAKLKTEHPELAEQVITTGQYEQVIRSLVSGIRQVDSDRLIVVDGTTFGTKPVHGLADLGVVQSTRGYSPGALTHYQASWSKWLTHATVPTWPMNVTKAHYKNDLVGTLSGYGLWDKQRYYDERIAPWKQLENKGVSVHVGEWGAYNKTPHAVTLRWMRDLLSLWRKENWGYALWEFRGGFGIFDSGRSDVKYETVKGRKLDRKMLALLQEA